MSYLVSAVGSLQCDVFILTVIHLCAVMPGTREIVTVNHLSLGVTDIHCSSVPGFFFSHVVYVGHRPSLGRWVPGLAALW